MATQFDAQGAVFAKDFTEEDTQQEHANIDGTTTVLTSGSRDEFPAAIDGPTGSPFAANALAGASLAPMTAIGPRVRKSPFFNATRRHGCNAYSVYNHMYMPLWYDSPVADFWHLVNDVTIWDVSVERQVQIAGPDAVRLAQLTTPRNLKSMVPGRARYALLCDEDGGVVNDPVVLRLSEDVFWFSLADSDTLLWIKGLAKGMNLDVKVTEPDVSPLQIQGPKSTDLMRDLVGDWIDDLKYFHFKEVDIEGAPCIVSRTGWSNERGYEIFLRDSAYADALWDRLFELGAPYGVAPGAPSTIRRIEAGLLSYGSDMSLTENPLELGFERLVDFSLTEDECLSMAALRRVMDEGVKKKMIGLEVLGETPPSNEDPWRVSYGDKGLGVLTSGVYSPRLEKYIALAFAPPGVEIGDKADVTTPNGVQEAIVVGAPFYDPKKKLVRE